MGIGSLSDAQFTRCNTRWMMAPAPKSPGGEAPRFSARADGGAGPPSFCPAPRRPLPQSPALPPTWRSAPRGEGAAVSSHSPALGAGLHL